MIGQTLSHYQVLERLGGGGMGEVYLAEDLRLHRRVALKMLRGCEEQDVEARARLLREARVASALNHPGIAVIYEVDELPLPEGARPFIAMELVAGRSLAEVAREGTLPVEEAVRIVREVAEALAEAHARGVVHRDVKPSNIMIGEQGRVKVLDFGLAQYQPLTDDHARTWSRPGTDAGLMGTVAYMSPEQARGRPVDARSDMFSLGAVFYELLAGHPPFQGESAVEVLEAVLRDAPPPIARPTVELAPGVLAVLHRMMAKDPQERHASARDLLRELDGLGQAPPPGPASANPGVAVLAFINVTGAREDDWIGTGIAETVASDLRALPGLTVLARERVQEVARDLAGKGREADEALAVAVGRELRARWVVCGAYQRHGEQVRVTARLVEVANGAAAATVKLDGRMAEIFALQDRVVGELTSTLRLPQAPAADEEKETHVVEAYEAYTRGLLNLRAEGHQHAPSHETLDRAILFFEKAVALDPGYAKAHLHLGTAWDVKATYLVAPELHERAMVSFRRALALRPGMAKAWRELGACLVSLGREDEGLDAIQRALLLDPDDAAIHSALGRAFFIGKARFAEAAASYERALALNPRAGWSALQLAHCCALLRDFERGEAAARRAADLQEELLSGQEGIIIVGGHVRSGHLAALQGRYEAALAHFEREHRFLANVDHALGARIAIELQQRIGGACLRLGRDAEGRAALQAALAAFEDRVRFGADEPFTRYYAAGAHALLGDSERALACLEAAASVRRAYTVARARIEPEFETLRGHPRYQALVGG